MSQSGGLEHLFKFSNLDQVLIEVHLGLEFLIVAD